MPVLDFKCEKCGKEDLNVLKWRSEPDPKCCGETMDWIPGLGAAHCFPVDGITLEHVAAEPVTFHSKKEMRDYARVNKLELGALL